MNIKFHQFKFIALFDKNPKLSFPRHELKISPTNLKIKVSERSCYTIIRISMFILKAKGKLKQTHGAVVIFAGKTIVFALSLDIFH